MTDDRAHPAPSTLTGAGWRRAMGGALAYLELYRDAANALNVFPVPDGDTGTNMLLTLRAGVGGNDGGDGDGDADAAGISVGGVAEEIAGGAFWGARGNSGVILSQMLRGLADGLAGVDRAGGGDVAAALAAAADAAYAAVSQPREGTMLSVIRGASEAAAIAHSGVAVTDALAANSAVVISQDGGGADAVAVWQAAYDGAVRALALTPEQLPVLKEAGVVDSGGLGVVAILGGALRHLQGHTGPAADLGLLNMEGVIDPAQTASVSIDADFLAAHEGEEFGYCTQFVIHGAGLDTAELRAGFDAIAQSTVVIGGGAAARVHIHTENPGAAMAYAIGWGELDEIKIDNMSRQNRDWASGHRGRESGRHQNRIQGQGQGGPDSVRDGVAVVAVAAGPGLAALFRDAGCAAIIPGGQTLNPSAAEILAAAREAGVGDVIVLPNNDNVILTAEQAAAADTGAIRLHVVPTRSMPQGTAAMVDFNPVLSAADNLAKMEAAPTRRNHAGKWRRAVRDSVVDGQAVAAGRFMAIKDGTLVALGDTAESALRDALPGCGVDDDCIVTLYWGADGSADAAAALQESLAAEYPGAEVEVYAGGQPHYPYLVSVE